MDITLAFNIVAFLTFVYLNIQIAKNFKEEISTFRIPLLRAYLFPRKYLNEQGIRYRHFGLLTIAAAMIFPSLINGIVELLSYVE